MRRRNPVFAKSLKEKHKGQGKHLKEHKTLVVYVNLNTLRSNKVFLWEQFLNETTLFKKHSGHKSRA